MKYFYTSWTSFYVYVFEMVKEMKLTHGNQQNLFLMIFLQILRQNILTMNNNVNLVVKFPHEGFKMNSNSSIN